MFKASRTGTRGARPFDVRRYIVIVAVFIFALGFTSCGGGGTSYSYQNVTVTIAPVVQSLAVNATQTFTATVTNAPDYPDWFLSNATGAEAGSFTVSAGNPQEITYTAPSTPPIYTADQVSAGAVQGSVTLSAFANNNPKNLLSDASASMSFVITGPVSVTLAPMTASVTLGQTQQFSAFAVGSTNTGLTWQVNGVTGGGTVTGTISTTGLYTAPGALPMAGDTVMVTAISQADTTKSASATVTLTSAPQ